MILKDFNDFSMIFMIFHVFDPFFMFLKGGRRDQAESKEPYLLRRKRVTVPQVGLEESSGSDLMNNGKRKWSRPPRVEVEGDDVDMCDPKAAVMKMLNDAKALQEKTQQEKKN